MSDQHGKNMHGVRSRSSSVGRAARRRWSLLLVPALVLCVFWSAGVSVGEDGVQVPDLRGKTRGAAGVRGAEVGLKVRFVEQLTSDASLIGRVIRTSPKAGTSTYKGGLVIAWVGKASSAAQPPSAVGPESDGGAGPSSRPVDEGSGLEAGMAVLVAAMKGKRGTVRSTHLPKSLGLRPLIGLGAMLLTATDAEKARAVGCIEEGLRAGAASRHRVTATILRVDDARNAHWLYEWLKGSMVQTGALLHVSGYYEDKDDETHDVPDSGGSDQAARIWISWRTLSRAAREQGSEGRRETSVLAQRGRFVLVMDSMDWSPAQQKRSYLALLAEAMKRAAPRSAANVGTGGDQDRGLVRKALDALDRRLARPDSSFVHRQFGSAWNASRGRSFLPLFFQQVPDRGARQRAVNGFVDALQYFALTEVSPDAKGKILAIGFRLRTEEEARWFAKKAAEVDEAAIQIVMRTQADWYDLKPSSYRKGSVSYHVVRCMKASSVLHGHPVKSTSHGLLYMTAHQGTAVLYLHAQGWKPAESGDGLHSVVGPMMKAMARTRR